MTLQTEPTWKDLVQEVLQSLGGEAHLSAIYSEIEGHKKTATNPTWQATVRRTLQQYSVFEPREARGVWALTQKPDVLQPFSVEDINGLEQTQAEERLDHDSVQGMLLNLGRIYEFETYAPPSDASMRRFEGRPLADFTTVRELPDFSTRRRMRDFVHVDVIWLRGDTGDCVPHHAFEVEHTRNIRDALLRLYQFTDANLRTRLYVVAPSKKERKFETEIARAPFNVMKNDCKFRNYTQLLSIYEAAVEHAALREHFL